MKPFITITDPEAFQLIADATRRKIIFLLRVKEMTACQIAEELDITPQGIYHHIRKLLDAGMIEVVREERVGHLIESYYQTTAETFNFSMGAASLRTPRHRKVAVEQEKIALEALKRLDFKIEYNEKQVSQLIDVKTEIHEECCEEKLEDKIAKLEDLDLLSQMTVDDYVKLLSMSNEEFSRQQDNRKKLRELLLSLVKK